MNALQARILALQRQLPSNIQPILQQIDKAAEAGEFETVWHGEINESGIKQIESLGFLVEAIYIGYSKEASVTIKW